MADDDIDPCATRPDSPFLAPEIVRAMAAQRVQRIADYRAERSREARLRRVLGELDPKGWGDDERMLDAEQERLAAALEAVS